MTATESKHTPGPWRAAGLAIWGADDRGPNIANILHTHHPERIAAVQLPSQQEAEANAALIAAGPELLTACKAMLERWEQLYPIDHQMPQQLARNSIAKAEGKR